MYTEATSLSYKTTELFPLTESSKNEINRNSLYHSEDALIKDLRSRRQKAIVIFAKKIYPKISHFVKKNNGFEEDAQDLFHDAIIVLYKKVSEPGFQQTASIYTFFYAICKYSWLKKLRYKKNIANKRKELIAMPPTRGLDELIMETEKFNLYQEKFEMLSENAKKVLGLYFDGYTMVEIAQKMNFKSAGYARKRKHQCKEKLIKLIQQDQRYKELVAK